MLTKSPISHEVKQGPLLESGWLSAGLDYYKPTMSQVALNKEPEAEVEFTLKNRGNQRLLDYINIAELQKRFNQIMQRGWSTDELSYLASIQNTEGQAVFSDSFIEDIGDTPLPPVLVEYDSESDDLAISSRGPWFNVSFWETVVMSELNEMYFEEYLMKNNINPYDVYDYGNRQLDRKINILNQNPGIKIVDFGTRRHFSLRWQKHVVERLMTECPANLSGTSNVGLAQSLGIKPVGTFAHEMLMVYAGLAEIRGNDVKQAPNRFMTDWFETYGNDLAVALTDTFTTDFFLSDFTPEQAEAWRGVRHDSGDPFEFGQKIITFYQGLGIDPATKSIVFSDGLDIEQIVRLYEFFSPHINVYFGWGTTLTNDLGINPLNIVMKATYVHDNNLQLGTNTVKLSDNPGKHTGPEEKIAAYQNSFSVNN